MEDYIFIYKDTLGRYNLATNPEFIAKANCCRAFKKDKLKLDQHNLIKLLNESTINNVPPHYVNYINEIKWQFSL